MKKLVLGLLVALCVCAPCMTALADDDPVFQISWSMFLPRSTFFIGETITFRVEAYAAENPLLKVPDQYANIVVRNESMFEVFSYWVMTDNNGSAWVNWTTELDYANGTYMIILTDGFGAALATEVTLLWDQNIAWQRQIDDLQVENDYLWGYLDELYSSRNYLYRRNTALTHAIYFLAFGFAVTLYAATWVAVREYIRTNARLPKDKRSSIAEQLGFRSQPYFLQTIDHAEAANYIMPAHHRVRRFGEDYYCPICEKDAKSVKDAKIKMTQHQWEEHMHDFHDRKLIGFRAWVKKRHFKDQLKRLYGKDDATVIVESLKVENLRRERLMLKAQELDERLRSGTLLEADAKKELTAFRQELCGEPAYKGTAPRMVEKPSQPQGETAQKRNVRTRKVKVY